jgi:hypothetical protein
MVNGGERGSRNGTRRGRRPVAFRDVIFMARRRRDRPAGSDLRRDVGRRAVGDAGPYGRGIVAPYGAFPVRARTLNHTQRANARLQPPRRIRATPPQRGMGRGRRATKIPLRGGVPRKGRGGRSPCPQARAIKHNGRSPFATTPAHSRHPSTEGNGTADGGTIAIVPYGGANGCKGRFETCPYG